MSTARVDSAGKVFPLDGRAAPEEVVTEADVQDPAKLARLLGRLLKDTATLRRARVPKCIDFEDQAALTAGNTLTLQHNFNGRVRVAKSEMRDFALEFMNLAERHFT